MENINENVKKVKTVLFKELKHSMQINIRRLPHFFPFVSNAMVNLEKETYVSKVLENVYLFFASF